MSFINELVEVALALDRIKDCSHAGAAERPCSASEQAYEQGLKLQEALSREFPIDWEEEKRRRKEKTNES